MKNIETKVKTTRLREIESIVRKNHAKKVGVLAQTDTYIRVQRNRLKFRETVHDPAIQLVWYQRADSSRARESHYEIVTLTRKVGRSLLRLLSIAFGVATIVKKKRALYVIGHTRIHLDRVSGLGEFVELETVLRRQGTERAATEHRRIAKLLNLERDTWITKSYGDLMNNN